MKATLVITLIIISNCCLKNQYYNTSTRSCLDCLYPCSSCINVSSCLTCYTGYYINPITSTCDKCGNGCFNCTNSTVCITCTQRYYYDNASKNCRNCPNGCTKCTNSISCSQCNPYAYYFDNTTTLCQPCMSKCGICINSISCLSCFFYNYYINTSTNTCQICDSKCYTCINSTACSYCFYGSFLNSSTSLCDKCYSNCYTCINSITCSSCYSDSFLNSNTSLCNKCDISCIHGCQDSHPCVCPQRYYLYYDYVFYYKCYQCNYGCKKCISQSNCTSCLVGYYLNIHYYKDNTTSQCIICDISCATCINSSFTCTSCYSGYLNKTNNLCMQDLNCLEYDSDGCTKCKEGFRRNQNRICQLIPQIYQSNHSMLIGIIVTCIVGPVFIGFGIYLYCRNRIINRSSLVQIRPPQIQISQIRIQNKFDILDDCSICLENNCDLITTCNHYYHYKCLKEWTLKQRYCPLCRNINLSVVTISGCLKCKEEQAILDVFDVNFLENVEKARKDHKCKNRQQQIQHK